ncbi:MAG TPA: hypothetical protein VG938_09260 [Verrucomicrobiae bacterium]|jgi:hypothetical protein|nr:hypothetical protein [Verrucomicrobiae bacterium]
MSTLRFRDLVKTSGRPEPKSLWTDPRQDREFRHAVEANRVLTMVQPPASKKTDFGEIGFHRQPHASYFIFPKPLPAKQGKVIGIKYDLVEQPEPEDPVSTEDLKPASKSQRAKPVRVEKKMPVEKTFEVRVRRVAIAETSISVKAQTASEARKKAIEMAKSQKFDAAKEDIKATAVTRK